MSMNEASKSKKSIRIELSIEKYQHLTEQANQQRCSLKSFINNKLLDDMLGAKLLSDRIMQMMPLFYNIVAEIEDESIRKELTDLGGMICQHLK